MVTLRVIADGLAGSLPSGLSRYTEELTKQLIATAPKGCDVEALVTSDNGVDKHSLASRLGGPVEVRLTGFTRAQLSYAWQFGLPPALDSGMLHSPSLLAPLRKHDRAVDGKQSTVTIHDLAAWRHPESLPRGRAAWLRAMARRAEKFADAIVVPTHAVAEGLGDYHDFGDRLRVIAGAVSTTLVVPRDADAAAQRLGLPDEYVFTVASPEPRKGLLPLLQSLSRPGATELPLVVAGPAEWSGTTVEALVAEAGLPPSRVTSLGVIADKDLAVAYSRAAVFVHPSLGEGFGLSLVEAFHFGVPVIHSDDAALVEVAGGAGVVVERNPADNYAERLADAISNVLDDTARLERLAVLSRDRSRAFSWRDSAERIWQLHADL